MCIAILQSKIKLKTLLEILELQENFCNKNPLQNIPSKKIQRRAGGHKVIKPNQLAIMFKLCPNDFIPWLAIAAFAGLRNSEICGSYGNRDDRITWQDISFKNNRIIVRLETSKSGRLPRYILLHPGLLANKNNILAISLYPHQRDN